MKRKTRNEEVTVESSQRHNRKKRSIRERKKALQKNQATEQRCEFHFRHFRFRVEMYESICYGCEIWERERSGDWEVMDLQVICIAISWGIF